MIIIPSDGAMVHPNMKALNYTSQFGSYYLVVTKFTAG